MPLRFEIPLPTEVRAPSVAEHLLTAPANVALTRPTQSCVVAVPKVDYSTVDASKVAEQNRKRPKQEAGGSKESG